MLKKLSLIAIICVLAYSQVGYYFVIRHSQNLQKRSIKQKIKSQLTDKHLQIISLTDNKKEIYWEEEGKEFFFKGEMFDVVKTKILNGNILLYCINDKKEKELVNHYNTLTKENSSTDKKSKIKPDNSTNLFLVEHDQSALTFVEFTDLEFSNLQVILPVNNTEKISPPPKA